MRDFLVMLGHSFFGELGDKSFLMTAVLASWCPWAGVREGDGVWLQQILVFAGAMTALLMQLILQRTLQDLVRWPGIVDAVSCGLLALMAVRAGSEASRLPGGLRKEQAMGPNPFDEDSEASDTGTNPPAEPSSWNQNAFLSANYGSASPTRGSRTRRTSFLIMMLAYLVPLCVCFLVEVGDKSQRASRNGPEDDRSLLTKVLGMMPATGLAVFFGFITERQCVNRTVATVVLAVCLGLTIVSLSQAFLQFPGLAASAGPTTVDPS